MSRKLGIPPTSSCPNRPVLQPFVSEELLGGERGGGHCGVSGAGFGGERGEVSGDGIDDSGLGAASGAGFGAANGGEHGVERGVVNGSERGVELGAVNSGKRGVELGVASGDGRGVERCETSGSGLGGDCGEVSGAGFGAVNGVERGVELGVVNGSGRGVELGAVNGGGRGVELGAVNGGERGVERGVVNGGGRGTELVGGLGAERGLKADLFVNEIAQKDILELCGSGILVTDFNGGNCNSATGDFSYGVSGFLFENGKITSPIDSMLITGNMTDLWSNLLAAGSDPVPGMSRQVPTLAFRDVTFNA